MLDIQQIVDLIEESSKTQTIEISADIAFDAVDLLSDSKVSFVCGSDKISSSSTKLDRNLFKLKYSRCMPEYSEISDSIAKALSTPAIKSSIEFVIAEFITPNLPVSGYNKRFGYSIEESMGFLIGSVIDTQISMVRNHIKISEHTQGVRFVKADYSDSKTLDAIFRTEGIIILNGGMGSGKTQGITIPGFNRAVKDELFPVGLTPKKVLAASIVSNEFHYRKAKHESKGIFGVVNSVVGYEKFEPNRAKCKIIFAEEHEEIVSQCSGRAVGTGSIVERADLLDNYYAFIAQTETVVLIDALFSQIELDRLMRKTGKKVTVVTPINNELKLPTVNFVSEAENVAIAADNLLANKKVVAFCDGSNKAENSKFNEIYHSVAKFASSSRQVTASSVQEEEDVIDYINNIESDLLKYQYSQISPVISSGVSIQSEEFEEVNFFGNQVISMKQAIQTIRRFRNAKNINVSINRNNSKIITSTDAIIANELLVSGDSEMVTDEMFKLMKESDSVNTVVECIRNENYFKFNYESFMILALRELGFTVTFNSSELTKDCGKNIKKAGSEVEKELRTEALIYARHISQEEYQMIGSDASVSQTQKEEIASFEMRKFYDEQNVTKELVDFDDKGKKRVKIENLAIALADSRKIKNNRLIAKKVVIDILREYTSIDLVEMTGEFSKEQAEMFCAQMQRAHSVGEMKVKDLSMIAFGSKLETRHAVSVVSKMLSEKFGVKLSCSNRRVDGKQVRVYSLVDGSVDQKMYGYAVKLAKRM